MNNMINPMQGFIQGNQLASQQANDGLGQQRQRDEQAMRAIQMIGSISLGAKGGSLDGQVDPAKFEQGLDFLQQNGVNVSSYRGRPEVADVAARASMSALQQIQGGMAATQAALQLQATLVGIQQRQQAIELQGRRDTRDEARAQRQETMQQQQIAQQGIPAGFRRSANGGVEPIPGGPQDPAVIKQQAEARGRGEAPRLDSGTIGKLSDAGSSVSDADRFIAGFQDNYAGWRVLAIGDAANQLARNTGIGNQEAATWWQSYDRFKNKVRNELFGSALTATEKAAFEKADINPGMTPAAIRANLEVQRQVAEAGAKRLAGTYVQQGRSTAEIEAALGIPLSRLGLAPKEAGSASAATPAQGQPATRAAAPAAAPAASPRVIGPAPAGATEGRTGRLPDGTRVIVRNGQLVVAE